jgi:hypothetical protein
MKTARDDDERVPERFREVQWTRLPGGETPCESKSDWASEQCLAVVYEKLADPLMDPLRQEPRFQAILRELNFPRD